MLQFKSTSSVSRWTAGAILGAIAVACLSLAQTLFVPVIIALLLAVLLQLPLRALERAKVPRWFAAIVLTSMIGCILWLLVSLIAEPLQTFSNDYRQILAQLRTKFFSLRSSFTEAAEVGSAIAQVSGGVTGSLEDPDVQEVVVRDGNFLVRAASSVAESATTLIATLTICAFILVVRQPILTIATMWTGNLPSKLKIARIWRNVETHIAHFFLVTTTINIGLGVVVGTALYLVDVPMAPFWGVMVGLLNYMPFIGPTIGAISLFAFCVLQFSELWMIILPPFIYLAINFVEANFVTPSLVGRKTEIPTLAIILSLFFWGWLWGFIGLLIAIPLLVIAKAVSVQVPEMAAISRVLTPRKIRQ